MKITENIGRGEPPGKFWNKKSHLKHFGAFLSIKKMNLGRPKKRKSVKKLKTLMPDYKVWDEITYPFLNFIGCTVEI